MKFLIYSGARQIGTIDDPTARAAFRAARAAVRTFAFCAGQTSAERVEYPRGRVSITRGNYRAVNEARS